MKRKPITKVTWHQRDGNLWRSNTGCTAVLGTPETEDWWHVSVSHPHRYPTWDELAEARDAMVPPDIEMYMAFPKVARYVNVHQTCLHLWELPPDIAEALGAEGQE